MDAIIMCCNWHPAPPYFVESDKVKLFALEDILIIGKSMTLSGAHWWGGMLFFLGGKFTEISVGKGLLLQWFVSRQATRDT